MKRYLKRLLFKEEILKDWLFLLPLLFFFSNFIEVIYDYFDNAPYTNIGGDVFTWLTISLMYSSPFFLWRYISLKRYFQKDKQKIFISYATNDQALVETIKSTLENNSDYEYWWQKNLKAGQNYREEIEKTIKNSSVILIMYSNNYEISENIQDWELPFINAEEENRDDLIIIPCVVGEYEKTIPFSNKYQVVPSRSMGFHRMISSQVKKEIKHLSKVINHQFEIKDDKNKDKHSLAYSDSKLFTTLLLSTFGLFIFGSVNYIFSFNKVDNSLDKAMNFGFESISLNDETLLLIDYYEVGDFYDESNLEIIMHKNESIYINLLNDYLNKEELREYSYEWNNLLITAYNVRTYYVNYLISVKDDDLNEQQIRYNIWKDSFDDYGDALCSLLDVYILYEDWDFSTSSVWEDTDYENICNEENNV
jgi:hypothetical protein